MYFTWPNFLVYFNNTIRNKTMRLQDELQYSDLDIGSSWHVPDVFGSMMNGGTILNEVIIGTHHCVRLKTQS